MVNKCAAFGCANGSRNEKKNRQKNISAYHFPKKKPQLFKFDNRREWRPTSCSVLCEKHFKEDLIIQAKGPGQRSRLKWTSNPIPTIHLEKARRRPSVLPTKCPQLRNPPKIRNVQPDQLQEFLKSDVIHDFNDIDVAKHCPTGFQYKNNSILFYRKVFDNETEFPVITHK